LIILLALMGMWACKSEDEIIEPDSEKGSNSSVYPLGDDSVANNFSKASTVNFNLNEVPYDNLSDYNFFIGEMVNHNPVYGVIPYDVITPLFADYAHKFRFIWMPEGTRASYNGDHDILSFQDGTVLIKTFYFDNVQPEGDRRVIETRLEFMRNGQWEFAEYVWNDEQTEATLDLEGSFTPVQFLNEENELKSINWRIPSEAECKTCHKLEEAAIPIGPKPQNINRDYNYADGTRNQLLKLIEMGYLESDIPVQIETVVPWDDTSYPLEERVRAYVDMNCAHCHRNNSHCDYRPIRLAWEETVDPANLGVCVEPDQVIPGQGLQDIIVPGNAERSVMYFRINTEDPATMMPLIGRSIVHEEGRDLILEYINSLEGPC